MESVVYAISFSSRSSMYLVGFAAVVIVFLLILSVRRRRDEPIAGQSPASKAEGGRRSHWFLGIFYANPDDPALFVRKRFGYGRTLNFGHWVSWLILTVPILVALVVRMVAVHH